MYVNSAAPGQAVCVCLPGNGGVRPGDNIRIVLVQGTEVRAP